MDSRARRIVQIRTTASYADRIYTWSSSSELFESSSPRCIAMASNSSLPLLRQSRFHIGFSEADSPRGASRYVASLLTTRTHLPSLHQKPTGTSRKTQTIILGTFRRPQDTQPPTMSPYTSKPITFLPLQRLQLLPRPCLAPHDRPPHSLLQETAYPNGGTH